MATKVKSRPSPSPSKNHAKSKPKPVVSKTVAAKVKPKPSASGTEPEPLPDTWIAAPVSCEECLQRIQTLSHRVDGYVRFMKKIDDVRGTSAEAKQKALIAFYERLLFMERELGRIQEELQLG